ncbi:MAG: OmpA family protein [Prevotella sp.]|nr:OmpA family protein [Prevotella sp.]
MNIKKSIFATLLAGIALGASAQEAAKTEYVFQPHWYVQGQFGAQYTLGEVSMGKLISPNAQLGVGYNFGKVVGARFIVNAWQSKGGSEIMGETYKWKYNYVAPMVDVTFNISNLISGVNPCRLVDVTAFIGGGVNIAFNNDEAVDVDNQLCATYGNIYNATEYEKSQYLRNLWSNTSARAVGHAGLAADFKVAKNLSVGAEIAANFLSDTYNSKKAGNVDWYFNGLVGVKYSFGDTYKEKKIEPVEPKIVYRDRIVEKIVEKPVEKKVVPEVEPLRMDIFFNIAKFKLLASEQQKVGEVAAYMKKYPQTKVVITGLADKGTGNDKINIPLSKKRAEIVKEMLVKQHGIDASRITAEGKGSSEQPYTIPELNRVSICVVK